jgi:hypothetical protein
MQSPDQNVERNRQLLLERSLIGLKKYGVTTERDDLTLNEWLQHLLEELLDAANYVQAAMNNAAPDTFAQRFSMYEGMLLWILYHHQGGKSTIGQPIRRLLGIKQHAPLSAMQVQHAEAVARMYGAPDALEAEPSAADTSPPTPCQTIHLGQPGVTVEPCLMLGPDEEEVACLLFTAPGTEVRLTWPTQTQAAAVLAAATAEDCTEADAQPVACECGDSYPLSSHAAGFIEGRGHCANCAAGAGEMASLLGVSPAPVVNQQLTTEPGPAVPLAARHYGLCISARGLLVRVGGHLKVGAREMLKHLEEMATRYYAGDIAAVDEFLQLYCLDEKRPAEQKETN